MQAVEDTSAQLQQQLAQKGTDLSSAEQELARLQQKLSQTCQSKHEVKLVLCLHNDNTLHMARWTVLLQLLTFHQDLCCADACSIHFSVE